MRAKVMTSAAQFVLARAWRPPRSGRNPAGRTASNPHETSPAYLGRATSRFAPLWPPGPRTCARRVRRRRANNPCRALLRKLDVPVVNSIWVGNRCDDSGPARVGHQPTKEAAARIAHVSCLRKRAGPFAIAGAAGCQHRGSASAVVLRIRGERASFGPRTHFGQNHPRGLGVRPPGNPSNREAFSSVRRCPRVFDESRIILSAPTGVSEASPDRDECSFFVWEDNGKQVKRGSTNPSLHPQRSAPAEKEQPPPRRFHNCWINSFWAAVRMLASNRPDHQPLITKKVFGLGRETIRSSLGSNMPWR